VITCAKLPRHDGFEQRERRSQDHRIGELRARGDDHRRDELGALNSEASESAAGR